MHFADTLVPQANPGEQLFANKARGMKIWRKDQRTKDKFEGKEYVE